MASAVGEQMRLRIALAAAIWLMAGGVANRLALTGLHVSEISRGRAEATQR